MYLILYRVKNENRTQCLHQDQEQRQIGKAAITKLIRELSGLRPIDPHWHAVAT